MPEKDNDKKLTRRGFIKGTVATTGSLALVGLGVRDAQAQTRVPKKWNEEADVVILGFGGAGACAAIEAADAGAKVIILEKQPKDNLINNTRMSGGIFHCPDPMGDRNALKEYARAMFSGDNLPWLIEGEQPPDLSEGLAEAWAEYSPKNVDFLKKLDPSFNTVAFPRFAGAAFPNFPGAKECKYRVFGSSFSDKASFDVPTKDLPKAQKMNGEAFFYVLRDAVEKRKVKVLYATPAKRLVANEKGEVLGVMGMQKDGREIAVKARRAVIITTGGYEFNKEMRKAFLEGPGVEGWAFYGSPENTGDGIEMAMKVGAGLAKVGKAASRMIAAVPLRFNGLKIGMITDTVGGPNSIVIGPQPLFLLQGSREVRHPQAELPEDTELDDLRRDIQSQGLDHQPWHLDGRVRIRSLDEGQPGCRETRLDLTGRYRGSPGRENQTAQRESPDDGGGESRRNGSPVQ